MPCIISIAVIRQVDAAQSARIQNDLIFKDESESENTVSDRCICGSVSSAAMESAVHGAVPLRVGKKMRKRRELDALVGGGGSRGGRLLSASSDEGEPWGRRTSRRRRSRPFVRLAAGLAFCVCVVSAATVLWLFVDVRRQIVSLRVEMDRVTRSNSAVDDELQTCHTTAKELQAKALKLEEKIAELEKNYLELVIRVDKAGNESAAVASQLSAAPMLADTPRRLAELQRTVADIGSQINGLDGTITSARKQVVTAVTGVEEIRVLVHQLDAKANETIANITAMAHHEDELKGDINSINSTLTTKVEALQSRIQELSRPVSTAAPAPVEPASAPAALNVTAPATTLPPGPPVKPPVLH